MIDFRASKAPRDESVGIIRESMLAVSLRNTVAASISVSLDLCQALVMSTKRKYYAVVAGRKPGIYDDWDECKEQVCAIPALFFSLFCKEALTESLL